MLMTPTLTGKQSWLDYVQAPRLTESVPPSFDHPVSQLCTQSQIESPQGMEWFRRLKLHGGYTLHRKFWELLYVGHNLERFGLLTPGRRGLAFGVGQDRLPYVFANMGVDVLSTDLSYEASVGSGWIETSQHASGMRPDMFPDVCPPELYERHVQYRDVDMNAIPEDLSRGQFDFCWSCCSLEHVGSIELGLQFIMNSLKCLKPGGVAIHTTEFNLSSDRETIESGATVLFRRRDILDLQRRAEKAGWILRLNLHRGDQPADQYIDVPPYENKNPHLKLRLSRFTTTSIGLILCRPTVSTPPA